MKLGKLHIHWFEYKDVLVKFHIVNFSNKGILDQNEVEFNDLLKEGWRVNDRFEQEQAVVYELFYEGDKLN